MSVNQSDFWQNYPLASRVIVWLLIPLVMGVISLFCYVQLSLPSINDQMSIKDDRSAVIRKQISGLITVEASSQSNAFFALGYAHAHERLWQMEIARRTASGELSEVFGEDTLSLDKYMRILGFKRQADKITSNLDDETKKVLQEYVKGINQAVSNFELLPLEFETKRLEFETWHPSDSILVMLLFAWESSKGLNEELSRIALSQSIGADKALKVLQLNQSNPITTSSLILPELNRLLNDKSYKGSLHRSIRSSIPSWGLSGQYTSSGLPLIVSDYYNNGVFTPKWFPASIDNSQVTIKGVTIPGLPIFLSGSNEKISWSMVPLDLTQQNLVLERINPLNINQYEVDGELYDMELFSETIRVKQNLASTQEIKFVSRQTKHGPVISDVSEIIQGFTYSVKWTGASDIGGSLNSFVKLLTASSWEEFNQSLSGYVTPTSGFIYVDVEGNLGGSSSGHYFEDASLTKQALIDGSNSFQSKALLRVYDMAAQESVFNPKSGVVTPNQLIGNRPNSIKQDDFLISKYLNKFSGRIDENIASKVQDKLGDIVNDEILKKLLVTSALELKNLDILNELKKWDYQLTTDSVASLVYVLWKKELYKLIISLEFKDLTQNSQEKDIFEKLVDFSNTEVNRYLNVIGSKLQCDSKKNEVDNTCFKLANQALINVVDFLTKGLGEDISLWKISVLQIKQIDEHFVSHSVGTLENFLTSIFINNEKSDCSSLSFDLLASSPILFRGIDSRFVTYVAPKNDSITGKYHFIHHFDLLDTAGACNPSQKYTPL